MKDKKPTPETTPGLKNTKTNSTGGKSENKKRPKQKQEIGGFADSGLPEPTRYGDWEVKGRCSDF